jgi:gas vesicle protein
MKGESFLALLAGTAIGAALGVLFAPDKGDVTRRKITIAAKKGYGNAVEKSSEIYGKVKEQTSEVGKSITSIKDILMDKGSDLKEDARKKALEQLSRLEKALAKDNGGEKTDPEV